jgi:hypothetical protein
MIQFDLIKNRIKRFNRYSQIKVCLEILDSIQEYGQKDYPLWIIIVLIKWILIHTKDSIFLRQSNHSEVKETLDLINQFDYENGLISFKTISELPRSLRIIAYQQFWLQDHVSNYVFDRQIQLYKLLKHKFDIAKEFETITKLTIDEFINIAYSVFLYFEIDKINKSYKYNGILHDDFFQVFRSKFENKKLELFFRILAVSKIKDIASLQKMSKEVYQLYETNFLSTKPFLFIDHKYKLPHRAIFYQTCKHFIYDFMKLNSKKFSTEFGHRMEKYVKLGLDEAKIKYKTEAEILRNYPGINEVADFLLEKNVLIEAKAIELDPKAAVLRYSELLSSVLKKSIVKAYCQLLSTANAINKDETYYALIITYKEMYLGFGQDAWEEFLQVGVEKYANENKISMSILPPENLCIIDIETWDYLIQSIIVNKCTIPEILNKAKENNHDLIRKKMLLDQVLSKDYKISNYNLSYLNNAHKYIDKVE